MVGRVVPDLRSFTTDLFVPNVGANSMFWTWLVALAFSQAAFNKDLHLGWRVGLAGLVLSTLYVAYFKAFGWKSG
jgi:hypothetical protein